MNIRLSDVVTLDIKKHIFPWKKKKKQVSRLQFKRLVSPEFASIMSLHAGEAYAMQNLTRTDRLALLLSGKVNVLSDSNFLHPILPCEFLDSPEFESSRASVDDKFKVKNVISFASRYVRLKAVVLKIYVHFPGIDRCRKFVQILVLAKIRAGVSARERGVSRDSFNDVGCQRYRHKTVRYEQQGNNNYCYIGYIGRS